MAEWGLCPARHRVAESFLVVPPKFGKGRYGCCGARKPAGETQNYCGSCKRAYMAQWRKAHHRRGDPYYERLLRKSNARYHTYTKREAQADREWRGNRVRYSIATLNAAGVNCTEIAARLGRSRETIYTWRSGKTLPTPRHAEALYRLLDDVEDRA